MASELDAELFDPRDDVIQLGFLALSLLTGRQLDPAVYPSKVPTLIEECFNAEASAPASLREWLERALQIGGRPFADAVDAQAALERPTVSVPVGSPEPPKEAAGVSAASGSLASESSTSASDPPLVAEPAAAEPAAMAVLAPTGAVETTPAAAIELSHSEAKRETAPTHVKPLFADAPPIPERRSRFGRVQIWSALAVVILGGGAALLVPRLLAKPATDASGLPPVSSAPLFAGATESDSPIAAAASEPVAGTGIEERSAPVTPPPAVVERSAGTSVASPPVRTAADAPAATAASGSAAAAAGGPAGQDRFGAVRFTAPIELQVVENGTVVGSTVGSVAVTEGVHTFDLVSDVLGFRSRQTVTVKAGRMTPVAITVPNGAISINAVPWADVLIDGKSIGQTPIANYSLPIGLHDIVFRHPRFGEQTQTAVVKVSGLTRVSASFQN